MSGYEVPGWVLSADVEDQSVVLNTSTGQYHLLNPTARAILDALRAGRTPDDVAADLAERTGTPRERVDADVTAFVAALAERGLIESR